MKNRDWINEKFDDGDYSFLFNNKFVKAGLIIGGTIGIIWLSGKVMRIVGETIEGYKVMKNSFNA